MNNQMPVDKTQEFEGASIQHGPLNDRIYLMNMGRAEPERIIPGLEGMARERGYSKIFAKVPESSGGAFLDAGYVREAVVPGFCRGRSAAWFLGKYLSKKRMVDARARQCTKVMRLVKKARSPKAQTRNHRLNIRRCTPEDAGEISRIYGKVFSSYPFPINDRDYILRTMRTHVVYFGVVKNGRFAALSSSDVEKGLKNVEMTDFATLPQWRGQGLARSLLGRMEKEMQSRGVRTAYTIARAVSPGMNMVFSRRGYKYGGMLVNNTHISGRIESMNVWHKPLLNRKNARPRIIGF